MSKTDTEFYKALCLSTGTTSTETAKKWVQAVAEVIFRELHYEGICKFPLLGTFRSKQITERIYTQIINGEVKSSIAPEHYVASFTPTELFNNEINDDWTTAKMRRAIKSNELTDTQRMVLMKKTARCDMELSKEADPREGQSHVNDLIGKILDDADRKRKLKANKADEEAQEENADE